MSFSNLRIIPEPGESIDSVIKRFKKEAEKSGIREQISRHQSFQTPLQRKREKARKAQVRANTLAKKAASYARIKGRR